MNALPPLDHPYDDLDASDLARLARFRGHTAPISNRALVQGRLQLEAATATGATGRRAVVLAGRRRPLSRRLALLGGAAAVLGVALAAGQLSGITGSDEQAQAREVLDSAASAVQAGPTPRGDQFLYHHVLRTTDTRLRSTAEIWTSADGNSEGLVVSREQLPVSNGSNALPAVTAAPGESSTEPGVTRTPLDRYTSAMGLLSAPYTVLATLPTDTEALKAALYADPAVADRVRVNGDGRDAEIWSTLRDLVRNAPPAQAAALLRVAATLKGVTYVETATDAAGRPGHAVGLQVPHLGNVQLIFDPTTHAFLGERIVDQGKVTFNEALLRTAVVDRAGIPPAS